MIIVGIIVVRWLIKLLVLTASLVGVLILVGIPSLRIVLMDRLAIAVSSHFSSIAIFHLFPYFITKLFLFPFYSQSLYTKMTYTSGQACQIKYYHFNLIKFFQMSSNTTGQPQSAIHLFFTPVKPPQTYLKVREDNFVLDCTNPATSKLPSYAAQHDQYNQSYLSLLFAKNRSGSKENRVLQSPQLHRRKKQYQRAVSREDFRSYLQDKINSVTQTNLENGQKQPKSYLNSCWTSSQKKRGQTEMEVKEGQFLDKKFKCFRVRNKGKATNE